MVRLVFSVLVILISISITIAQEQKDAYLFFQYEKISKNSLNEKFKSFCAESDKTGWVGWIINFGTPGEIEERENQLKESFSEIFLPDCHRTRIIFVRGGEKRKSRTEMWIVKPGSEPPI